MDKSIPLVVVIVMTYNEEEYIAQTLKSLLKQKCTFKYKIIINDDNSSDKTPTILKEYAKKNPDLIDLQLNSENIGIVSNYFNAIARSKSDYIAVCSGDDWWCDPYKLQKQVDFLVEHPDVGVVYTGYKIFCNNKYSIPKLETQLSIEKFFFEGALLPALTVCYRRNLVEQYIKEVNPISRDWSMEDLPMWIWFYSKSKIDYIKDITSVYRIRSNSALRSNILHKELKMIMGSYSIRKFYIDFLNKTEYLRCVNVRWGRWLVDTYLKYNKPVDDKVLGQIYKFGIKDGKYYLKYLVSKSSVLRNLYLIKNKKYK